jgi:predicted Zn-dependent protease
MKKQPRLYGQLVEKERRSDYYFTRYIDCLVKLEKWDEAEKAVKKQIKEQPDNNTLYVVYGTLFRGTRQRLPKQKCNMNAPSTKWRADYSAAIRLANMFLN